MFWKETLLTTCQAPAEVFRASSWTASPEGCGGLRTLSSRPLRRSAGDVPVRARGESEERGAQSDGMIVRCAVVHAEETPTGLTLVNLGRVKGQMKSRKGKGRVGEEDGAERWRQGLEGGAGIQPGSWLDGVLVAVGDAWGQVESFLGESLRSPGGYSSHMGPVGPTFTLSGSQPLISPVTTAVLLEPGSQRSNNSANKRLHGDNWT
ncbi:unnamed protein product [Gadus morhua 'NCC']